MNGKGCKFFITFYGVKQVIRMTKHNKDNRWQMYIYTYILIGYSIVKDSTVDLIAGN